MRSAETLYSPERVPLDSYPGGVFRYLVEEVGLDVKARDHDGNTKLHHAASRGDNEMILYLLWKGAAFMP